MQHSFSFAELAQLVQQNTGHVQVIQAAPDFEVDIRAVPGRVTARLAEARLINGSLAVPLHFTSGFGELALKSLAAGFGVSITNRCLEVPPAKIKEWLAKLATPAKGVAAISTSSSGVSIQLIP